MIRAMLSRFRTYLHELYEGDTHRADRFRYWLLAIDCITLIFIVVSTFFYGHIAVLVFDIIFGLYIMADFLARLWIEPRKRTFLLDVLNWNDAIVMVSLFLAPFIGEGFAFLRVIRILRLLRSYRVLKRLRRDSDYFKKNEDVIIRSIHMFIFVFLMTEIVYVLQVRSNEGILNFVDALYFTITALTTTGFGDITLTGTTGKLVAIIIMVCGVTLFLRLIKAIFRPAKVRFVCTDCGLFLHENDAIHCKHCGKVLNIPSDGDV